MVRQEWRGEGVPEACLAVGARQVALVLACPRGRRVRAPVGLVEGDGPRDVAVPRRGVAIDGLSRGRDRDGAVRRGRADHRRAGQQHSALHGGLRARRHCAALVTRRQLSRHGPQDRRKIKQGAFAQFRIRAAAGTLSRGAWHWWRSCGAGALLCQPRLVPRHRTGSLWAPHYTADTLCKRAGPRVLSVVRRGCGDRQGLTRRAEVRKRT
jgi:hypothetical protein